MMELSLQKQLMTNVVNFFRKGRFIIVAGQSLFFLFVFVLYYRRLYFSAGVRD